MENNNNNNAVSIEGHTQEQIQKMFYSPINDGVKNWTKEQFESAYLALTFFITEHDLSYDLYEFAKRNYILNKDDSENQYKVEANDLYDLVFEEADKEGLTEIYEQSLVDDTKTTDDNITDRLEALAQILEESARRSEELEHNVKEAIEKVKELIKEKDTYKLAFETVIRYLDGYSKYHNDGSIILNLIMNAADDISDDHLEAFSLIEEAFSKDK